MKRILIVLTTMMALFIYGCETTDPSFDDSLPNRLTLSLIASPDVGGTLIPSEVDFENGDVIEIEALPSDGFLFQRWMGDFEGEDNPAILVMTGNKSVTNLFRKISSLITIKTTGEGTVLSDFDGQTVSLSAVPSDGWTFSRWEIDLSGSENPAALFLDEEKSVTALFDPMFTLIA